MLYITIVMIIKGKCKVLWNLVGWKRCQGEHVEVIQSDGHSWNGWLMVYKCGKLIYSTFGMGLLSDVVSHILRCQHCKKTYKGQIRQLRRLNKMMDDEWQSLTA